MDREYLPLGTVVILKGAEKKLMIVGRLQKTADKRFFDYCAVLWPEGMLQSDEMFLFNQEDVDRLYFIGMQDLEEFEFRTVLADHDPKLKNGLYM